MDGGLLQLVAIGNEDIKLINKPEITFFKKLYKRTELFSLMDSSIILDNIVLGGRKLVKIPKVGDLLSKIYLEINIPDFSIKKLKENYISGVNFIDTNYSLKKKILNKILEVENLEDLYLNNTNILSLSKKSSGYNILISKLIEIGNKTNVKLDYNYKEKFNNILHNYEKSSLMV